MIPKGQTITHIQQAMHVGSYTYTSPVSGSLRMVPLGQASIHGATNDDSGEENDFPLHGPGAPAGVPHEWPG